VNVADIITLAGVTVGGTVGYSLVSKRRSVRRVLAQLVGYVLLASIVGLLAAFMSAAGASPFGRASSLARGISETMNCSAYGLLVGAAVAMVTVLWRRLRSPPSAPPPSTD
jgi:Na+/phosphate symporter